jgi:hypothetical protein
MHPLDSSVHSRRRPRGGIGFRVFFIHHMLLHACIPSTLLPLVVWTTTAPKVSYRHFRIGWAGQERFSAGRSTRPQDQGAGRKTVTVRKALQDLPNTIHRSTMCTAGSTGLGGQEFG